MTESDETPEEAAPEAAPKAGPEQPRDEPSRTDDGLELAKALTRATAGSTPKQRARWRNKDRPMPRSRVTGSHPDDRDPQPLGSTVSRLIDDHGWELDLRMRGVFARWPELVGDEVAAHCTPETFTEGKLVVRTDSTAWATQLRLLAPAVVRRLNEDLGNGTVTLIEVLGPHLPNWKKGPRSSRDGRGPRDTYG